METQEDKNAGGNGCGDGGGDFGVAAETSCLNNRFDSFMSQLNNYGFKKKGYKRVGFEHEHFHEGKQHLLKNIKKLQQYKVVKHTSELEIAYAKVKLGQIQINEKIQQVKDDIENKFNEVQNNPKDMTDRLLFTFSEDIGPKRKFTDIDHKIDFDDIEKHFESVFGQCDVSDSYDVESLMILSELSEKGTTTHSDRGGGGDRSFVLPFLHKLNNMVEKADTNHLISGNVTHHDSFGTTTHKDRGGGDRSFAPPFLQKLYDMVEKEDINHLVSWNVPHRASFIISDINKFASDVLPMYFSHANFSSFNSQLNTYGFKKVSWKRHEYANEWFIGGRYDLLVNIKRRDKKLQLMGSAKTYSSTQVDMFKNRLKTIQQDQESKIIWFSKYEEQMKISAEEFKETVNNMANIVNKMILKSNEKLENYDKKVKLDIIEDGIIGNQKGKDLVDELRNDESALGHNTNVDVQSSLQEREIHLTEFDQTMEMQDSFVTEKEMGYYLHTWGGNFK